MESEILDSPPETARARWTVETTRLWNGTYRIRVSDGLGRSAAGFGRDAQAVVQQCVNAALRQPGCSFTVVDGSII
jgi:hypothetical protein